GERGSGTCLPSSGKFCAIAIERPDSRRSRLAAGFPGRPRSGAGPPASLRTAAEGHRVPPADEPADAALPPDGVRRLLEQLVRTDLPGRIVNVGDGHDFVRLMPVEKSGQLR